MKTILTLTLALLAASAWADDIITIESGPMRQAVVELYTSEGCASCPPAERWLKELADMPATEVDVMPLAFHVDYWDYIGWKDEFAQPQFTRRQHELMATSERDTVYTPAFFVDGVETRGVFRILQAIREANSSPSPITLRMQLRQTDDRLVIDLQNDPAAGSAYDARFVVFENELANMIKRGENRGKHLRHQRVVRYFSQAQRLQQDNRHEIRLDPAWNRQQLGVGVMVTRHDDGRPVQSLYTLLQPGL